MGLNKTLQMETGCKRLLKGGIQGRKRKFSGPVYIKSVKKSFYKHFFIKQYFI